MSDWKTLAENSIRGVHQGLLERKEVYSIDFIFRVRAKSLRRRRKFGILEDFAVRINSHTINTFAMKGCNCDCGLKGAYFALERHENALGKSRLWHLVLYAVNEKNEEVMMTRDHIVPKSKGGKNLIENHHPMCLTCNHKKSDRLEETSLNERY